MAVAPAEGDVTAALYSRDLEVSLEGHVALSGVSVSLSAGWTAIVGPNGAGKSTLLRTLAGLRRPDSGEVWLHEQPLARHPARERARQIAWMGQQGESSGDLTVREVVHLGRLPHLGLMAAPGVHDEAVVQQAMALTECQAWQHRYLHQLSGGERQRVLLACALAVDAPILLLDEPTTHLDPPHQVALVRLFKHLAQSRTVATVLHDLPLALCADHLVVMQAGRVVAQGRCADRDTLAAVEQVFGHAIRIERVGGRLLAIPRLD